MDICDRCYKELNDPAQHGLYICPLEPRRDATASVIGDEIHEWIRHGVCHDDGTPRLFTSRTELKRAANEAGLTFGNDTPKPYKVAWSGITSKKR